MNVSLEAFAGDVLSGLPLECAAIGATIDKALSLLSPFARRLSRGHPVRMKNAGSIPGFRSCPADGNKKLSTGAALDNENRRERASDFSRQVRRHFLPPRIATRARRDAGRRGGQAEVNQR